MAVNSATAALHLSLEALNISPGDEIIVPTLTFTATAEVVRYLGAIPVFIDICPTSLCLDTSLIEPLITPKTRAIIAVHFGGLMCDMNAVSSIAQQYGLKVIEDAAHAFPAKLDAISVGSKSDAACFSFYANKTITTGEGGMLITRSETIAKRSRIMRLHGIDRDVFNRFTENNSSWYYDIIDAGYKYNLTDIAASIGLVQLSKSDLLQQKREKIALKYTDELADLPLITAPTTVRPDSLHAWHLYVIRVLPSASIDRDKLAKYLMDSGIHTSVHYRPLHTMTYWRDFCHGRSFPNSDKYFNTCLSLPIFPEMTDAQQDWVIECIRRAFSFG